MLQPWLKGERLLRGGAAALVAAGLLAGSSSPALAAAAPPALSPPAAPSAPGPSLLGVEPSFPSPLAAPPIFAASAPLPLPTRFPPLPKLALPPYSVTTLPNGLRLFLLEDHEVPLVRGSLLMRGGEYASPKGKAGLASIAAGVQRYGGSTAHPGDRLDDLLDDMAASVEAGAGIQALSLSFDCERGDVATVLPLLAEVLRSPALPEDKIALYKTQVVGNLEHKYDSPDAVARLQLQQLVYGRDSVYARTPTIAEVNSITRDDIIAFLERWERPDGAVMGIVGDFKSAEMVKLVNQVLGDWEPAAGQPPQAPPLPGSEEAATTAQKAQQGQKQQGQQQQQQQQRTVYLVDRPGSLQASISTGELGPPLTDTDAYALNVLGTVFNSFGGRLFDQLRTRDGLAYTVAGSWTLPLDHAGLFSARGSTSRVADFLPQLRAVLSEATRSAPTAAELSAAKSQVVNAFVFNFASSVSQLQRIIEYALIGLPQDFVFQFKSSVEAVTAEQVLAAAQTWLHPDRQVTVVVADASAVRDGLEKAGFKIVPLKLDDL